MTRETQPPVSQPAYITPEGRQRLQQELDYLWRVKRPQVTKAVAEAAALGDRSENAEYIYGKKQLREIDRRVRFLQKRLDELIVVDRCPADQTRIYFGAWVTLENEQGQKIAYRIVGKDEFDIQKGLVSVDSPLAQALLKKKITDKVSVKLPSGKSTFVVADISYGDRSS